MRSHVEFRSQTLLNADEGEPNGESVARLLAEQLPEHGYEVQKITSEDWGWRVELSNPAFPLSIGCGHYEEHPDGHMCFIEPSKPYVRSWLRRIPTSDVIEPLATAIEQVLCASAQVSNIRWWTEAESNLGRR